MVQVDSVVYDTIITDYYIINHSANLFAIIDFVDTTKSMIEVRSESRKMDIRTFQKDYERIETPRMEKTGFHTWENDGKEIHQSNNWTPKFTPPLYTKDVQYVIKTPGTTREEVIPAHYISILAITPKDNITSEQLNTINKLCHKFYIRTRLIPYTKEKIIPRASSWEEKHILKENAKTILVPIQCRLSKEKTIQIQRKLTSLKLYSGSLNSTLNNSTKKGLILYQKNHHLPIGQLDEKTLKHLL